MQDALLNFGDPSQPKFDLVGPTVDDDVRRIMGRYGRDAVLEAVKRATKRKRGRKAEPDWPELDKILKLDARRLLEGGDPFVERTNYSIATTYTDRNPGHSRAATHRRILKKLAEKRVVFTLINAYMISQDEYPHGRHITILHRLNNELPDWSWGKTIGSAEGSIRDYTAKHGPPAEQVTMREIEDGARALMLRKQGDDGRPAGGLFGLLGKVRTTP